MKQTTNNKGKRIAAGIAGGALVLGLLLTADAIYGDPLSPVWAEHCAVKYAESLYPGQTFRVLQSGTGSLFGCLTFVQSEQSEDTWFDVQTDFWFRTTDERFEGEPPRHEFYVESGMNTCMRLGREASEEVDAVLERELPQYQFVISTGDSERGSFVDICYSPDEAEAKQLAKQFPELVPLDTPFSKEILAKVPSYLSVTGTWPTTPTQADVDEVLAQVKQVMEQNGYRFAWYNITLTDATAPDYEAGLDLLAESGDVAAADIPAAVATPETAG